MNASERGGMRGRGRAAGGGMGVALALLFSLAAGGCGDGASSGAASGDPGRPGTEYGTKMGGPIVLSDTEQVQVFGTAAVVSRSGLNHFFMIPHTAATPSFKRAYLSIWLPGTTWAAGTLTDQTPEIAVRISLVTLDGREFSLGGEAGRPLPAGSFTLTIDRVVAMTDPTTFVPTGRLQARLRGQGAATGEVPLDFQINNPNAL